MTRRLGLVLGVLLVALVAACGAPAPAPDAPPGALRAGPGAPTPAGAPLLTVARLGLTDVPLQPLGLNPDRTLQVPPVEQPETVGVYRYGPRPGQPGPAVILGHVNGGGRDGAFRRLEDVQVGDAIGTNDNGIASAFRVSRVDRVPKERFPTGAVYSDTRDPELRLITCGGAFNGEDYADNIIVYAAAVP